MTSLIKPLAHRTTGFVAWFRRLRPFDRRAIRVPAERDLSWANIQRRLAESDAAFLTRNEPYGMLPARRGSRRRVRIVSRAHADEPGA